MLIVTVRLSRAFTGCGTASAAAQKDAEHIQRHEAGEIPATLPTKNAGTMAPAFFFMFCCFRRFYAPSSREPEAPAFGQAAAFYAGGGDFAFFSRLRNGEAVFGD